MSQDDFDERKQQMIERMGADAGLRDLSLKWYAKANEFEYSYHFTWLGRPIIQYPQDIVALQEVIWNVKPEVIVETGIARGGSLILSASILQLIGGEGRVVGIDIDIRPHNRVEIEKHPLAKRITMIQGSSIDPAIAAQAAAIAKGKRTLVVLDSNHTHAHVAEELRLYSPLVGAGSYLIVLDTGIEVLPADSFPNRPWGRGNNPMTAVREFLKSNDRFAVDAEYDAKLQITVGPSGYLKCVKD